MCVSDFPQQGPYKWHVSCVSNQYRQKPGFFLKHHPHLLIPFQEHLSSGMATSGLDTIWWLTENNSFLWEESALFLLPSDHFSADHISESHSHRKHHNTTWRWWYTTHRADAVLTVHLQRKHEPVLVHPTTSYEPNRFMGAWLLVLMSSSGHGDCCPDLQFRSSATTSLGLRKKWSKENCSMRLPYTQQLPRKT